MNGGERGFAEPVHVIGATGRSGQTLVCALLARGVKVVAVARDRDKVAACGFACPSRIADLSDASALPAALAGAGSVASCAHARYAPAILSAAPAEARFVLLGSTRKFTRWPDDHARGVLAGEAAFLASGRRGVMLHPTMIYGAAGENNVRRLARLMRFRIAPLPGGGRALVQPIHQEDVTASVVAALEIPWTKARSLVIAGPKAVAYADFCRAVARAAGVGGVQVVPVPASLIMAIAPLASRLPFLPRVGVDEVRRLGEDKAFDIAEMIARLRVVPRDLEDGLAETFASSAGVPNAAASG